MLSLVDERWNLSNPLSFPYILYACESGALEKGRQVFEMRCYQRLLNISYKDHVTNEEVYRNIQTAIEEYVELQTLFRKRKLRILLVWRNRNWKWMSNRGSGGGQSPQKLRLLFMKNDFWSPVCM